jgi:ubiquinone biosynthesis protein COQ4
MIYGRIYHPNLRMSRSLLCLKGRYTLACIKRRSFASSSDVPFYGLTRSQSEAAPSALGLLIENAATAISDPTRADAVAAVGELTGSIALRRLYKAMQQNSNGQVILKERPIVSKDTIPYQELLLECKSIHSTPLHKVTFGQAYGAFLDKHGFDPDERDAVRFIADTDLAYVMLRYRQNHDFYHTLTELPPTVLGELGLKWLELFQTGLPLAAFSGTIGSLRLDSKQQHILWNDYIPWAKRISQRLEFGALMMVFYERELDTPLVDLRRRLGIEVAPRTTPEQS